MGIVFEYQTMKSHIFGDIRRPIANVLIRADTGEYIEFHPFIDSGADMTLLPYSFGLMLGFSEKTGNIKELHGVRGIGLPVIIKRVKMTLGDIEIEPRVAWSLIEEVPPLLGRLDIFEKFEITFKEKEGEIIFEPVES